MNTIKQNKYHKKRSFRVPIMVNTSINATSNNVSIFDWQVACNHLPVSPMSFPPMKQKVQSIPQRAKQSKFFLFLLKTNCVVLQQPDKIHRQNWWFKPKNTRQKVLTGGGKTHSRGSAGYSLTLPNQQGYLSVRNRWLIKTLFKFLLTSMS